ncbi:phage tail protein [Halocynthiibacter namhaensis]|uniref:phage tail protein n=1 Tax=Halocynthiibacter namhaensis TaxID=1290553 RepID=UPI0005791986|nr:phage tail protein [Halocynthiibacter namhaensis]
MFKVGEVDVKGLKQFDNLLGALGQDGPKVVSRALNRTGDMARTKVVRELSKQTGLPQKTIREAVKVDRSSWQDLEYRLTASGGEMSLKYFKARETLRGVTASVRGKRELFEGSFIKGGSFDRGRVVAKGLNGHVFQRIGGRTELEKLKSGVFIPVEMVEGATAKAFDDVVSDVLPRRLDHEINRLIRS